MRNENGEMIKKGRLKILFFGFPYKEREIEIERFEKYSDILSFLDINPETVVILKDGVPIPTNDEVEEGEIKVIRVISGG
jgi:sulfur carrier protein